MFANLPQYHYGLIYADPPWRFDLHSAAGEAKSPQAHYGCEGLEALARMPVARLAAPDCALVMWATAPMLSHATALMEAWGFEYKTAGAWAKQSATGESWAFGTGFILRSAAEFFLIGTRGNPKVQSRSVRNLIVAPVREHSRKPDDGHAICEQLYAGPYLELFARQRRQGWDCWGNETTKFGEGA